MIEVKFAEWGKDPLAWRSYGSCKANKEYWQVERNGLLRFGEVPDRMAWDGWRFRPWLDRMTWIAPLSARPANLCVSLLRAQVCG